MANNQQAALAAQAAQAQAAEGKKGKEGPSLGERVSSEFAEVGNVALAGGGVTAAGVVGGLDAAVTTASFGLSRIAVNALAGKPTTAKDIRNETAVALPFTAAIMGGVKAIQYTPKYFGLENVVTNILGYSVPAAPLLVAGLNFFVLTPVATALLYPLVYLAQHGKFEGMGKYFKENYLKGLGWTIPVNLYASGVLAATYAGLIASHWLFPLYALANIFFYIFSSPDISYIKKLLSPVLLPYYGVKYLVKTAYDTVGYAGRGIKGLFTGLNDVGSAFSRAFGLAVAPATR